MRPAQYSGTKLQKGEFTKNIGKLAVFMKRYIWPIIISLIFTIGATVLSIFAPQILSDLVDVITVGIDGTLIDMSEVARFAIILIIF